MAILLPKAPVRATWSRATFRALEREGKDARVVVDPGEPHAYITEWERSMRLTVRFFERHL
jgi:dipeptidyl aminopeptidase/acylaminoacyl peptidase